MIKHIWTFACFCLLFSVAVPGQSPDSNWVRPFFVVLMADPQVPWENSEELFPVAVSHANRLQPDFTVMLGDLTHASTSRFQLGKLEDYTKRYFATANTLTMPVKLVAGNHDVLNTPTKQSYDFYVKNYGELWYSFEHRNNLFIVLESNILKNPGKMPGVDDEQVNWLSALLKDAQPKNYNNMIVFLHHSVCNKAVDEKEGYYNIPPNRRAELLQLFHEHDVTATFSGHYHRNAYVRDGDLEMVTITSTGVQEAKDKPGFMVLKVDTNGIKHNFYTYEEMPEFVEGENAGLSLTYPNGGEVLTRGKSDTITWNSRSMAAFVKLEYSAGTEWQVITDSTSNNGFFPWTVPDKALSGAKVRITTLTSKISDESDGGFAIKAAGTGIRGGEIKSGFLFEVNRMRYQLVKPARTVQIYSLNGELVNELKASNRHLIWDGKNMAGKRVSAGVYLARIGRQCIRFVFSG